MKVFASRWFRYGPKATGTGLDYLMAQFERMPYALAIVIALPVGAVVLRLAS